MTPLWVVFYWNFRVILGHDKPYESRHRRGKKHRA